MEIDKAIDILKRLKTETVTAKVDNDRIFEPLCMAIEALEKQIPLTVKKGEYIDEIDGYGLLCPICNEWVGELINEDDDGVYKYNLNYKHCSECGQNLKQE